MASNLRKGLFREESKTKNIGFLAGGIPQSSFINDGFYSRIFGGIERVIEAKNYHLIFSSLELKPSEPVLPSVIRDMKVDGVLIESTDISRELVNRISECVPAVLLNYSLEDVQASSVMPDNSQGIHKAVSYLYRLGHRKIAFFAVEPFLNLHAGLRFKAYLRAIREMELVEKDDYIKTPEVNSLTGKLEYQVREALDQLLSLRKPPTAIIFAGDVYALAFLKEARKRGVGIPKDLSLIGFDDVVSAGYSHPALTTIRMPLEDMGRTAVNLLFERMEGSSFVIKNTVLNVELVIRDSCSSPDKSRFR
jgi:DNA-binding LacI/PurR family transcriptional regulator